MGMLNHESNHVGQQLVLCLERLWAELSGAEEVGGEHGGEVGTVHLVLRLLGSDCLQEKQEVLEQGQVDRGDQLEEKLDAGHL